MKMTPTLKYNDVMKQCGFEIGRGSSRRVYENTRNRDTVIKVCDFGDFTNIREWELWSRFQLCEHVVSWLAPCVGISLCGRVLVQERTYPCAFHSLLPKVPLWVTDLKKSNWGYLPEGLHPVCHDYASHLAMEMGTTRRLKKAQWRDE